MRHCDKCISTSRTQTPYLAHAKNSLASVYNCPCCKVADPPEILSWNDRRADKYYKCTFEDLHPQHVCRGEAVHEVQNRLADVQKNHETEESQSNPS
jgi:hypothetical protein